MWCFFKTESFPETNNPANHWCTKKFLKSFLPRSSSVWCWVLHDPSTYGVLREVIKSQRHAQLFCSANPPSASGQNNEASCAIVNSQISTSPPYSKSNSNPNKVIILFSKQFPRTFLLKKKGNHSPSIKTRKTRCSIVNLQICLQTPYITSKSFN